MFDTPRPLVIGASFGFLCLLGFGLAVSGRFIPAQRPMDTNPGQAIRHVAPPAPQIRPKTDPSFVPPKPRLLADVKRAEARYKRTLARLGRRARCLPGSMRRVLARAAQKFGRVRIISTYRRGAVIAGSNKPSYHRYCRAVDFKIANQRAAVRWLKRHWSGGIGTYSGGMHHVHIDNGPRIRFHHRGRPTHRHVRRLASPRANWPQRNFATRG